MSHYQVPARASELIRTVTYDPEETAARWETNGLDPQSSFSSDFLMHAMEHHVEGLVYDVICKLGLVNKVAPYIVTVMKRRAELSEAAYEAYFAALSEIATAEPDLITRTLLLKGAVVAPLYQSLRHRSMGDFDLVVNERDMDLMIHTLQKLGYEQHRGGFGVDMVKVIGPKWTWLSSLTMHLFTMRQPYLNWLDQGVLRNIACLMPKPELLVMNILCNTFGHSASWSFATQGCDLQCIRQIDIEVAIEKASGFDSAAMWSLAVECGLQAEVAIGLAVHRGLRGQLPSRLLELERYADAVAEYVDYYATPDGIIGCWQLPIAYRAFHPQRSALALAQLREELRSPEYWADVRGQYLQEEEPTHLIAEMARRRLREIGVESPSGTRFADRGAMSMV